MFGFVRRSLLVQLLSVYLIFVAVVLVGGVLVDDVVEQRLTSDVQAADQALAQEIALRTTLQVGGAEKALIELGTLAGADLSPEALTRLFQVFKTTRADLDQIFWLDPVGIIRAAWPAGKVGLGSQFSPPGVVQRALNSAGPVFEVGIATATTTRNAGVIIAEPVRNLSGGLTGILAASFSLDELSLPLQTVVGAQEKLGRHLQISIMDKNGRLVATPEHQRILQTVLDELPGADQALLGTTASRLGVGMDGQNWLFTAVPVPEVGWAAVVQRPAAEALAVVTEFRLWLLGAALLFGIGGLLFWLLLLGRVIRPLHSLALHHQSLPVSEPALTLSPVVSPDRADEVGDLARSLLNLERDGLKKLGELQTLLETSNAVVRSLEPHAVVRKIIAEVRRLVDVQAAAVLLPDEKGVLHVLVSDGHSEDYDTLLALAPENLASAPVAALHGGKPVQKLLQPGQSALSYDEGFRSVLAIPIIGHHAGPVVLLVHRSEPHPFDRNEIELLLTFANYATLAWEHAVLYERSDERLREIALENERLYRQASVEKQKLEAIMRSMSDGLVLAGTDGTILYANPGAAAILALPASSLEGRPIAGLYETLGAEALDHSAREQITAFATSPEEGQLVVEIGRERRTKAVHMRLFEVGNDSGRLIGRGLLLRDVTREHELAEFKTTLLSAVGHELRNPLAAIKGHASTLLQEDVVWSPLDQRRSLLAVSAEADRLARLVSNLLDLSRQEAGLLLLNRTPLDIAELVTKTLEQVNSTGAIILVNLAPNLPPVEADSARLEIVLHNLIVNALSYGEGEIKIEAVKGGDAVVVSVSDNGLGIAPDELPHVFERFYRAPRSRKLKAGGTGLGLTICKAFIEAHQGTIWAESGERGTTISFSLPVVVPQSLPDYNPKPPEGVPISASSADPGNKAASETLENRESRESQLKRGETALSGRLARKGRALQ